MASLPSVSGQRVVGAFRKAGWVKDRQHGSHVILIKAGHPASLSVPQHRELAPGTLRALIRASGTRDVGGSIRLSALIRGSELGVELPSDVMGTSWRVLNEIYNGKGITRRLVALTGVEPADRQFSSVQFSLSSCVFSTVGISGCCETPPRIADVMTRS